MFVFLKQTVGSAIRNFMLILLGVYFLQMVRLFHAVMI